MSVATELSVSPDKERADFALTKSAPIRLNIFVAVLRSYAASI